MQARLLSTGHSLYIQINHHHTILFTNDKTDLDKQSAHSDKGQLNHNGAVSRTDVINN
jgi:hypothetical protein